MRIGLRYRHFELQPQFVPNWHRPHQLTTRSNISSNQAVERRRGAEGSFTNQLLAAAPPCSHEPQAYRFRNELLTSLGDERITPNPSNVVPGIGEGCGRKSFCLLTPCQLNHDFCTVPAQPSGVLGPAALFQVELTNLCVPKRNSVPRQSGTNTRFEAESLRHSYAFFTDKLLQRGEVLTM